MIVSSAPIDDSCMLAICLTSAFNSSYSVSFAFPFSSSDGVIVFTSLTRLTSMICSHSVVVTTDCLKVAFGCNLSQIIAEISGFNPLMKTSFLPSVCRETTSALLLLATSSPYAIRYISSIRLRKSRILSDGFWRKCFNCFLFECFTVASWKTFRRDCFQSAYRPGALSAAAMGSLKLAADLVNLSW